MTSRLEELIAELCPNGVEYKKVKDTYLRIKGTPITASKMKEIASEDGEIRIFAGGKTVINAHESDIPKANITRVPAVLVQSRGVIDAVYYDKPFTFKNEMWAYTSNNPIRVKFLYYLLKNNIQYFRDAASGMGSLPQISLHITEDFEIPVPPLEVQEEIVRILDTFTELTSELTAELTSELTARKKQYEFYRDDLLKFDNESDELIQKLCPNGVDKIKLNEICKIYDGTHSTPQYKESGVKFVSVENINDLYSTTKYISEEDFDKYKIKPQIGDVFMTRIGSIGICNVVDRDEKLAYYVSLALLRPNTAIINSRYLKYAIESIHGRKELRKRTLVNAVPIKINKDDIGKVQLPVPTLEVQREIVRILDNFTELTSEFTENLTSELTARKKQYEYYRDQLLTFKRA